MSLAVAVVLGLLAPLGACSNAKEDTPASPPASGPEQVQARRAPPALSPAEPSKAPEPPATRRVSRPGYSFEIPAGYAEDRGQGADVVVSRARVAGEYTANIAVLRAPTKLRLQGVLDLLGHGKDSSVCTNFARGYQHGSGAKLIEARAVRMEWGVTCEVEFDRPELQATALTTIMKTSAAPVLVLGHYGKGDDQAHVDYEQLIRSWDIPD